MTTGTPTPERLERLRRKLDGIRATGTTFLEQRKAAGVAELSGADEIKWRAIQADYAELSEIVNDYANDLARVGTLPAGLAHTTAKRGRAVNSAGMLAPLHFDETELRRLFDCAQRGQPAEIRSSSYPGTDEWRAFTSVDGLLPPALYPYPVPVSHEWRVIDKLPGYQIDPPRPSVEFIRHISTSGAAAPTPRAV